MRKTLTYVVSLLVCLGLVGAVWAGKGGKKGGKKGGSTIPVTVEFRDHECNTPFTNIDQICSDTGGPYIAGEQNVQAVILGKHGPGRLLFSTPKPHKRPLERPLFFDLRPFCVNPITGARDPDCSELPSPFRFSDTGLTSANMTMSIEPLTTCVKEPCGFLTMETDSAPIVMQALFSIRGDLNTNVARLEFSSSGESFCASTTKDVQVQRSDDGTGKKQWVIEANSDLAALCVSVRNAPIIPIKAESMSFRATVTEK